MPPLCVASLQYKKINTPEKKPSINDLGIGIKMSQFPYHSREIILRGVFYLPPKFSHRIKTKCSTSGGRLQNVQLLGRSFLRCITFPIFLAVLLALPLFSLGPPKLELLPEVFIPVFLRSSSRRNSDIELLAGQTPHSRPLLVDVPGWLT